MFFQNLPRERSASLLCSANYAQPLVRDSVAVGFPSPAEGYEDKLLNLNELLIKHPAATFFVRYKGSPVVEIGLFSDDLLIVDRAVHPYHNAAVLLHSSDEFKVKRFIADEMTYRECIIWGVVTYVIHNPNKH